MRLEVRGGALLLLLSATASSYAQPGRAEPSSTPATPCEHDWIYEVALGPTLTTLENGHGGSDDYRSIGLRLGLGHWIAPKGVVSLRLAWNMMVIEPWARRFAPNPAEFSAVVGPTVTRWLSDRLWLAGTLGASFRHLIAYRDDGNLPNNGVGFAYGGNAGVAVYSDGVDAVTISVEATRALDGKATKIYSILVGYQRLSLRAVP